MGMGAWAILLLAGAVGGPTDPPVAMKDRGVAIPYNLSVAPAEVSEILLYVSIDQGKAWSKGGSIKPTEKQFAFQAPTDGLYWFTVAVVYKNGTQVPADVATTPPQQRVLFDTLKPVVRVTTAERVGEEIQVAWEIQDANPELASLKLEYRPAEATAGNLWNAVPTSPGMAGQAKFRPNTAGSVVVRVSMQDTAGNNGWLEKSVTSTTPITQATALNAQPAPPAAMIAPAVETAPPPPPVFAPVEPTMVAVATSTAPAAPRAPAAQVTTTSYRTETNIYTTNEPEVTLDYEIERQGPSGVSRVEVYMTQDEGRNWIKWQDLAPPANHGDVALGNKLPVTLRMPPKEGVFGFRMVPYSGSQVGAGAPASGDAPEVAIQVDRTTPIVTLFKPEADATQTQVLVLLWKASDANLTATPIKLFWAEQLNGEWKPIHGPEGLANTGRHAWQLPAGLPLKVFLKIVAEDKAGNVGEAATPDAIIVDLHKPVGRFKGIVDPRRKN